MKHVLPIDQKAVPKGCTMTIRKLPDDEHWVTKPRCLSPGHNPPMHISLPPGTYEHTCPGCGEKRIFRVTGAYMKAAL